MKQITQNLPDILYDELVKEVDKCGGKLEEAMAEIMLGVKIMSSGGKLPKEMSDKECKSIILDLISRGMSSS